MTDEEDIPGIDCFGESVPEEAVMKEYGHVIENVVKRAKVLLAEESKT